MSVDLQLLIWIAILCVLLAFPYTLAMIANVGPVRAMGYPQPGAENLPEWARRSQRAHLNMVENIAPFVILVVVAHLLGKANDMTAIGAQIFFWSRIAMVIGHSFAVPYLRTTAWFISLAGLIVIGTQLV